ncbi:MipA/OmpV family protein [Undibacterium sp. TJN25]|uniref:MipA/OmpV family protein n=1 Tax=Undibacterium sp. TJN25 TaxID=3413056 RepID=UPI003BF02D5C
MKKILCFALLSAALSGALPAFAQSEEFAQLTPPGAGGKDVNFSLGAALLSLPRYTGSDQRRLAEYPLFDAQWKNGAFVSLVSGLGYNLSKDPTIQYGLRVTVEPSRDESRSGRLHGLGDVDAALEPGVFFNYVPTANYALVSSLRYGSGVDRNGLQLSLGGRYTTALNNKHRLSATLDANWANSNYQQSYFGVTAAQAAASGYTQFTPSSGITDIRLGANWNWSIDSKWSLITGASVKHLVGDSARSPFVDQKNPVSVFSAASYSF